MPATRSASTAPVTRNRAPHAKARSIVGVSVAACVDCVAVGSATGMKVGAAGELVLKVERQNDYTGEFKVTVTLPKDVKGLVMKEQPQEKVYLQMIRVLLT